MYATQLVGRDAAKLIGPILRRSVLTGALPFEGRLGAKKIKARVEPHPTKTVVYDVFYSPGDESISSNSSPVDFVSFRMHTDKIHTRRGANKHLHIKVLNEQSARELGIDIRRVSEKESDTRLSITVAEYIQQNSIPLDTHDRVNRSFIRQILKRLGVLSEVLFPTILFTPQPTNETV